LKNSLGITLPDWQTSLPEIVKALIAPDSMPNLSI
jgi:hypothetical protein